MIESQEAISRKRPKPKKYEKQGPPQDTESPDAGLEEGVAKAIAIAEAAARVGTNVVVIDAVELEQVPEWVLVIQKFGDFADRLILLGKSDSARSLVDALARQGRRTQYVSERSPDAVGAALDRLGVVLGTVLYFGSESAQSPVRIAAVVRGLEFKQQVVSIEMLLRGFGVEPELAGQLAVGVEEALGLDREA